jgi:hypothetical protein
MSLSFYEVDGKTGGLGSVILSAAKDLAGNQAEILRCAQNDRRMN